MDRSESSQISRPLMLTFSIQTGPHAHERYGQFAAGDRPALDRFDMMGFTLWAGHILPLHDTGPRHAPNDDEAFGDLVGTLAASDDVLATPGPRS